VSYLLQFVNPYGEKYYLVRLGDQWGTDPRKKLVDATTTNPANAKTLDTEEQARELMAGMTSHKGWTIVQSPQ